MEITLPEVRIAFCDSLFEKKAVMGGKPQHSSTFIFGEDHPAFDLVSDTIDQVGSEKFKEKWPQVKKELEMSAKTCLKDGEYKSSYEGFAGNWFVTANNSRGVVGVYDQQAKLTNNQSLIYAGCYVNAVVDIWAMDNQHGRRICATLVGVQFVKDGDSFGGGNVRSSTRTMFQPIDADVPKELAGLIS